MASARAPTPKRQENPLYIFASTDWMANGQHNYRYNEEFDVFFFIENLQE